MLFVGTRILKETNEEIMGINNFAGFNNVQDFVDHKINLLRNSDRSMKALYELMFSERENIMFEESDGFKIIKTTYGDVRDLADRICGNIRAEVGAKSGAVVGIYMDNSPLMIAVFWAVLKAGYNPLLINMRLPDPTVENAIAALNASAVISDGKRFSINTICAKELHSQECEMPDCVFGNEFYVMSSGSVSLKLCAYTAENIFFTIENSNYVLKKNKNFKKRYNGELKLLTVLPFYHIFGLVAVYFWFAFFSCTFVCLNSLSPSILQNTIKRHKVTHIFAVPLFWNSVKARALAEINARGEKTAKRFEKGLAASVKLGNSPAGKIFRRAVFGEVREGLFGDSICCMISGGGTISNDTLRFFNGIGYPLINGYGMSEMGITSVELSPSFKKIISGSIGVPFPSVLYKIRDGELFVESRSGASYIIENGKKVPLKNTWYKTSDLAAQKDGRYYLLGRKDDLIVSVTGENINPNEAEQALSVCGIDSLCLIGGSDNSLPVLLASVSGHVDDKRAAEITASIKAKIAEQNLVFQIGKIDIVLEPLIRGNDFKFNRKQIRRDYYDGRLKLFAPSKKRETAESDELKEKIRQYFAEALGKNAENVGDGTDFFMDEGGTSIDYFALISRLQEDFRIEFPVVADNAVKTVDDMTEYIRNHL